MPNLLSRLHKDGLRSFKQFTIKFCLCNGNQLLKLKRILLFQENCNCLESLESVTNRVESLMHKNNALMSPNLVDEPKLNCGKKKSRKWCCQHATLQEQKSSLKFIILTVITNFKWYQLKNSSLWITVKFGMMMSCTCQSINRWFNLAESALDKN